MDKHCECPTPLLMKIKDLPSPLRPTRSLTSVCAQLNRAPRWNDSPLRPGFVHRRQRGNCLSKTTLRIVSTSDGSRQRFHCPVILRSKDYSDSLHRLVDRISGVVCAMLVGARGLCG